MESGGKGINNSCTHKFWHTFGLKDPDFFPGILAWLLTDVFVAWLSVWRKSNKSFGGAKVRPKRRHLSKPKKGVPLAVYWGYLQRHSQCTGPRAVTWSSCLPALSNMAGKPTNSMEVYSSLQVKTSNYSWGSFWHFLAMFDCQRVWVEICMVTVVVGLKLIACQILITPIRFYTVMFLPNICMIPEFYFFWGDWNIAIFRMALPRCERHIAKRGRVKIGMPKIVMSARSNTYKYVYIYIHKQINSILVVVSLFSLWGGRTYHIWL